MVEGEPRVDVSALATEAILNQLKVFKLLFRSRYSVARIQQEVHGKDCGYHTPEPLLDPVVMQFRPDSPDALPATAAPLARLLATAVQ